MNATPAPAASPLDDLRRLALEAREPDRVRRAAALQRHEASGRPSDALGRLQEIALWLAEWQGREPPQVARPQTVIFATSHGVAAHGYGADPVGHTERMVARVQAGESPANAVAAALSAGLKVLDLGVSQPTADIVVEEAMTERACAAACAFGMEAISDRPDALALGEISLGGGVAAASVAASLYGGDPGFWSRVGAWTPPEMAEMRRDAVAAALARHRGRLSDPLEALRRVGGRDIAACVGAILAARAERIPVVLDGFVTCVGAAVVHAINPRAIDHCMVGHLSAEPAHEALLERIGKRPLLDFDIRYGEGIGSSLGLGLLKAACAVHAAIDIGP